MIKFNKKKTKAIAFSAWWSNYIYWIPTIQTELHLLPDGVLTSFITKGFSAKGNKFEVTFFILGLTISVNYWWGIKRKNYE